MMFKKACAEQVLTGVKTCTRRPLKTGRLRRVFDVGKEYTVLVGYRDFGVKIKVFERYRQALGQMTEQDAVKEGFTSLAEFQAAWKEIYGKYDPLEVVWVYEFKLVK